MNGTVVKVVLKKRHQFVAAEDSFHKNVKSRLLHPHVTLLCHEWPGETMDLSFGQVPSAPAVDCGGTLCPLIRLHTVYVHNPLTHGPQWLPTF